MTIRTRYEFNLATGIGQEIPLTEEENARIDEMEAQEVNENQEVN